MDSLKDVVFVKVYLSGDLPADLQRLSGSLKDLLDEMRVRNPGELQYEFTDPSASVDEKTRNQVYEQLQKEGLQYTSIRTQDKGAQSEVIVWPGAIITYKGKSMPVQLLKSQLRATDAETVNRSINNLGTTWRAPSGRSPTLSGHVWRSSRGRASSGNWRCRTSPTP
ncbi:MAG: Gldg family protein [Flavobacteriales bacterium]|nr:Gldg family protein [Flavobacteriales bacterium]